MRRAHPVNAGPERVALEAKLRVLGEFLQSPGGRELVEHLAGRYAASTGALVGATAEKTYFNLGRLAVVEYLRELQALRKQEGQGSA